VYGWVPSTKKSSTPVTVTVCGTSQFAAVNTTLAGETVPSVASLDESGTVTSAVGCEVRTSVKATDVPVSEAENPLGAPTVKSREDYSAVSTVLPVTVSEVAEMVVVPGATAVARPPASMVATAVLDDAQVTEAVRSCVEASE
jgi:hypothetical protein